MVVNEASIVEDKDMVGDAMNECYWGVEVPLEGNWPQHWNELNPILLDGC